MNLDKKSLFIGLFLGLAVLGCMVAQTPSTNTYRYEFIPSSIGEGPSFSNIWAVFDRQTGTMNRWVSNNVTIHRFITE